MTKLLHIVSSPRKERSASREVAEAFVQSCRARRPDLAISTLDLWDVDLPEFGEDAMLAKYAGLSGTPLTPSQQQAWATLQELAQQLHWADIVLLSTPLWNFSIPYKLKHFIDLVSQKDILFSQDCSGIRPPWSSMREVSTMRRNPSRRRSASTFKNPM
jgi:FMN-dependent NADH-azoreductase